MPREAIAAHARLERRLRRGSGQAPAIGYIVGREAREDLDETTAALQPAPSLALAAGPAMAQGKSVKIGFVSTFSGPTAVIGNDMRNSFELGARPSSAARWAGCRSR